MKTSKTIAAISAGTVLALMMTASSAQTYMDPGPGGAMPSADQTVRSFPRTNTGSDPTTELPYAATAGRPPYAQGNAQ